MSSLQEQIEAMGGRDPTIADGFVVCTDQTRKKRIMATAVLHKPFVRRLTVFHNAFVEVVAHRTDDVMFEISDWRPKTPCLITFEAPEKEFTKLLSYFLHYLAQSRLVTQPIVCCKFDKKH